MVFADISGFTALTERLSTRGRIGAEELIETLNRVLRRDATEAAIRGGEMLKFGGDAPCSSSAGGARGPPAARRRHAPGPEGGREDPDLRSVGSSHDVGGHPLGPVDFFLVGSPTRELLILGSAGTATTEAEHAAVAARSSSRRARRRTRRRVDRARDDGLHRLRWRFAYPPEGRACRPRRCRRAAAHAVPARAGGVPRRAGARPRAQDRDDRLRAQARHRRDAACAGHVRRSPAVLHETPRCSRPR